MSNFHNAAETDVDLTGREQVLIQKNRCLFFDGKRHKIFENNFLNRTKYGLIFQKREKGFFFWKRFWTKREISPFRFPKTESFLFYVQPNGKIALYFLPKSYRGVKRHLFKRRQIGWHANKISL